MRYQTNPLVVSRERRERLGLPAFYSPKGLLPQQRKGSQPVHARRQHGATASSRTRCLRILAGWLCTKDAFVRQPHGVYRRGRGELFNLQPAESHSDYETFAQRYHSIEVSAVTRYSRCQDLPRDGAVPHQRGVNPSHLKHAKKSSRSFS